MHIGKTALTNLLEQYLGDIKGIKIDNLVDYLLIHGKRFNLSNRAILVSNQTLAKKAEKLLKFSNDDTIIFGRLLYAIRKSLKHRGITQINESHRDWATLKKCAQEALEFCNDFELPREEGFKEYIRIYFSNFSSQPNLAKLSSARPQITLQYEARLEIEKDPNPAETKKVFDIYESVVLEKTGIPTNYQNQPEHYLHFVKVAEYLRESNINPEDYIWAQFHGLEFAQAIPYPAQLLGDKAKVRFTRYCYENNIKVVNNDKKVKIDFSKIKGNGKNNK